MVAAGLGAGAQRQEGGPVHTSGPRAKLRPRACIKFGGCRSPARRVVGVLVRTKNCTIFRRTVFLLCDVIRSVLLFYSKSYMLRYCCTSLVLHLAGNIKVRLNSNTKIIRVLYSRP